MSKKKRQRDTEAKKSIVGSLQTAIDVYVENLGYRLEMITPADAPREALLSRNGKTLRLVKDLDFQFSGSEPKTDPNPEPGTENSEPSWVTGRAGMLYRDLIPGGSNSKVIASHIRLSQGGEVPDYVHYHKIRFQMIYCLRGRIRVVYEDQGDPFWLETGDCVLQPPEIRHRVLECTAGAEVIELSIPGEHETWVEHEIQLPTAELKSERDFDGQRFVRHIAADAMWGPGMFKGFEARHVGIREATNGFAEVGVMRSAEGVNDGFMSVREIAGLIFYVVLSGEVVFSLDEIGEITVKAVEGIVIPSDVDYSPRASGDAEMLSITI